MSSFDASGRRLQKKEIDSKSILSITPVVVVVVVIELTLSLESFFGLRLPVKENLPLLPLSLSSTLERDNKEAAFTVGNGNEVFD